MIWYQILQTNMMRIVWQTVMRFWAADQVDARPIKPETYFEYTFGEMRIFFDVSTVVNFLNKAME